MSTTQEEMDEVLDSLESEHDEVVVEESEKQAPEESKEVGETPPGFLSYEEWVDKGKDPADFRGENAYKTQYESLKEVRELKETMAQVVSSTELYQRQQSELMTQQIAEAKAETQSALDQAKIDEDVDAALLAQNKLNNLNNRTVEQPIKINPVITEFTKNNPIIDTSSSQYDAEFHQDMIMIHNGKLDQLLGGDRSRGGELTQEQIKRVQNLAFKQAKELHSDKFISPKNRRTTTPAASQRPVKSNGNFGANLKQVPGNTRNPRDSNAANDIYEMLKAKDPKAAETFAKTILGDSNG